MGQVDFTYETLADGAGLPIGVSIFGDRPSVREEMREDVGAAGFALQECGALSDLLDGEPRGLGEIVLLDCPELDGGGLAALSRLDQRVAKSGAHLVITTNVDWLDEIYGCCALSSPDILVNPRRADRIIALGRILAEMPGTSLRELSKDDRLMLLRVSEQVGQIADRMDSFGGGPAAGRTEKSVFSFDAQGGKSKDDPQVRSSRPPLPDPRLVRKIIQQRQLRARFLDGELFADPAWDMLLDLTASRVEHVRVSVTSLCIASGVPPTTALRWISQMTESGLLERVEDETDRRRAFIQLTDKAVDAMARFFHKLGNEAAQSV